MRIQKPIPTPDAPLSRPILADDLRADVVDEVAFEATEEERAALATLDRLDAVLSLGARFELRREGRGGARVRGTMRARIRQICVVSLDPFETNVEERIDVAFAPEAVSAAAHARAAAATSAEHEASALGGEEPPDPIRDGRIDLGRLAAEFLALGLDPYPRKPGVAFDAAAAGAAVESPAASPFAALSWLRPPPTKAE